ncbi:MAG: cobalt transporter [Thermoleophilia bacterium]|nr:cobalt transporter [Thermoleophilia bacterium]
MSLRRIATVLVFVAVVAAAVTPTALHRGKGAGDYVGIDESIMEARAQEAGREARPPFINTDQGDLLLFVFTVGGLLAGGALGYLGRMVFVEGATSRERTRSMVDGR